MPYPCRQSLWLSRPALISHAEPSLPRWKPRHPTWNSFCLHLLLCNTTMNSGILSFSRSSSLFICVVPDSIIVDQNSSLLKIKQAMQTNFVWLCFDNQIKKKKKTPWVIHPNGEVNDQNLIWEVKTNGVTRCRKWIGREINWTNAYHFHFWRERSRSRSRGLWNDASKLG